MVRLANRYKKDIAPYAHETLQQFYDRIRSIPYNKDPKGMEFLQRPYYTLAGNRPGGDCDDKAICMGAYASLHGYPFRFVAMGRYKDKPLHHVATDIKMPNGWVHVDPTYSTQVLGTYLFRPAKAMVIGEWQ